MKKVPYYCFLFFFVFCSCHQDDDQIECDVTLVWKQNCTFESSDGTVKVIIEDSGQDSSLVIRILAPSKWDVGGFFSKGIEFGAERFKYEKKWLIYRDNDLRHWQFYCRGSELIIGNINVSSVSEETRKIEMIWLVDDSGPTRREMFLCLDPREPLRP